MRSDGPDGGIRREEGAMILVAYASKHGATAGIASRIAERLSERGHDTLARPVDVIDSLAGAEAVLLGSALYAGSWRKEAVGFVDRFRAELAGMPVWLFSSGPLGDHVVDLEEQPRQLAEIRTPQPATSPRTAW